MALIYNINSKKILFIHIPKNAGGSLSMILQPYYSQEGSKGIAGHPDYHEVVLTKGNPYIKTIDLTLAIIRNPYERVYSWYHYIRNSNDHGHLREQEKFKALDFKESVKWLRENTEELTTSFYSPEGSKLVIKQQYEYLVGAPNLVLLRLEHIKEDFDKFCKQLNIEATFDTHFRKSHNSDYQSEYDEPTKQMVYEMYKEDFKRYDYEF